MEAEGAKCFHSSPPEKSTTDGTLNGTSIIPRDEEDLAATRRSIPNGETILNKRVHWVWDIFALGSILTFAADIGSDIFVAALYFRNGEYSWFGFTLAFVFLSSFTLQIFSAKWFHEDERRDESWWTYVLHFLHVGPVLRYWRAFRSGWKTRKQDVDPNEYKYFLEEWRDICFLRLLEAYLESAPQLVLQLYILAYHRRVKTESDIRTAVTAACSLVSLAWSIVAYTSALRDVMLSKISWAGLFFQIMWRFFMLASRITAFVLFASFYSLWLFVAVGIHWLLMFLFLVMQYTTFCSDSDGNVYPCREVCYNGIIAFVYNFSFFNISEGATRMKLILYYIINIIEATVFMALWYPHRALFGDVSYAAMSLVFGGFGAGIFFMIIYYQFYHPNISQKGFCFKKGEHIRFEANSSYMFTKFWCCCCEIRAIRNTQAWDNECENVQRMPPTANGNVSPTAKTSNPNVLNLDILPRHVSFERIPHLVNSSEAFYLKNRGRVEVPPPNSPERMEQEQEAMWI